MPLNERQRMASHLFDTILSTDNVADQMEAFRSLALLLSEVGEDKGQPIVVQMALRRMAAEANRLSLHREIIEAPCTMQQVLSN